MKNMILKSLYLTVFAALISFNGYGQEGLYGKWSANCVMEFKNKVTISFCDICPVIENDENNTLTFEPFSMEFKNDKLILTIEGKVREVNYIYDANKIVIEFKLNGVDYRFNVLSVMGGSDYKYILRNDDGSMILLEKEE